LASESESFSPIKPGELFPARDPLANVTAEDAGREVAAALGITTKTAKVTGDLLETCQAWIRRYIVVSEEQAVIMAAWLLHTYAFDAAETTPYIHITAPERACGKSRLMETLEALAAAPIRSGGMTAAALVRCIDAKAPTIFLDEMDAQLGGDKEYAEAIRGILNEGFRIGGKFYKCDGKSHQLREFNAYCPKCFAGIGQLPDTVASRSIVIEMRRKRPGEIVEPFRQRAVREAALPIKAELEAWKARGVTGHIRAIHPEPLAGLSDRQNDIAEPLLCIAQLAGHRWLLQLTDALQAVFKAASVEDGSIGVTLLSDIRTIFDERKMDKVSSKVMAECLCEIEGRPWAEWFHGRAMTPNNLARQLKKYRIGSLKIRLGTETVQGYRRGDFQDAWTQFCPIPPVQVGTMEQSASSLEESTFSNRNTSPDVPFAKSASKPHEQRRVPHVPVQTEESTISEVRI
jgi:hypothetical protein